MKTLVVVLAVSFVLAGCASAKSVKKQIAGDLNKIVQSGDCPVMCAMLKTYIKSQLTAP